MKTILVVDDEESLKDLYRNEFEDRGYRVLTASTGQQALDILSKEANLQLVITDLKHPEPNGRKLLQRIKQEWPKLPVIINTTSTSGREDKTLYEAEAYVMKSSDLDDLWEAVKRLLTHPSRP